MELELEGRARTERSGSYKRLLRAEGMIPAVVYGKNAGSLPIAVETKKLVKILHDAGSNALISMKIKENGKVKKYKVLVKALQRDPVRRELIHADFHQISLKDKVHAAVPVHLEGDAPGVVAGGILTPLMRRVEVECLATKIPESIKVDISGLDIGEGITVSDLVLPPEVRLTEDPRALVVTIAAAEKPRVEDETSPEEETAAETGKTEEEDA